MAGSVRNPAEAFQQLEAIMLRQMLQSSGAFKAGSAPGAQLRTDMFVETLADAVAKAGGLGIGRMLQHQLGGDAQAAPAAAPTRPLWNGGGAAGAAGGARGTTSPASSHAAADAAAASGSASASASARAVAVPAGGGVGDDLDDPNSEAPLPEDPSAASIDEFQPSGGRGTLKKVAAQGSGAPLTMNDVAPAPDGRSEVTSVVTSPFGPRTHPISGDQRFHTGVDLRAAEGAPIRAAAGGVVLAAGPRGGYGNIVEVDHGHGTTTLYAHASAVLVTKGQRVDPGQPLALVGHTGQTTGPHLHFELRRNDHPVNPSSGGVPISVVRALNRYRERAEVPVAGIPPGARSGDKP